MRVVKLHLRSGEIRRFRVPASIGESELHSFIERLLGCHCPPLQVLSSQSDILHLAAVRTLRLANADEGFRPHAALLPLRCDAVQWGGGGVWPTKVNLVEKASLKAMRNALSLTSNGAVMTNFEILAGTAQGKWAGCHWGDGDCYKWVEAVTHTFARKKEDPYLKSAMDQHIALFEKVQEADGYLSTEAQMTKLARWDSYMNHELYNMGHLLTAAAVHKEVTGEGSFLEVAVKLGQYLLAVASSPGTTNDFSGGPPAFTNTFNPSHIMGLVDLYRATGNKDYLTLAGQMVNHRGDPSKSDKSKSLEQITDQCQNRVPLRQESLAVGHCVTGPYLWCGAADVYAETGEAALLTTLRTLWADVAERKMYVTGVLGALHAGHSIRGDLVGEAFGLPYQLPNDTCYGESCASCCNAMWAWRMLSLTAECVYAEVLERALYDAMLAGWSDDGVKYRYCNPQSITAKGPINPSKDPAHGSDSSERWTSFHCYCCPPNIVRTVAGLHRWVASVNERGLWVHLYANATVTADSAGDGEGTLKVEISTEYPWEGQVIATIIQAPQQLDMSHSELGIMFRIPSWAKGTMVTVNGGESVVVAAGEYAEVRRVWNVGDVVKLSIPMQLRLVQAKQAVEADQGRVALMRGPIVYCVEGIEPDVPKGVTVEQLRVPVPANPATPSPMIKSAEFKYEAGLLGGVGTIAATLKAAALVCGLCEGQRSPLYSDYAAESAPILDVAIRFVPYYAWNNRGVSQMAIWLRTVVQS